MAGTKIKMIGIREDDFRAEFFERFIAQALYGSLRAHREKEWSFDRAMRSAQASAARAGRIGLRHLKGEIHPRPNTREQDKQDRKSTRLNSSHRCNSYAVFCL